VKKFLELSDYFNENIEKTGSASFGDPEIYAKLFCCELL